MQNERNFLTHWWLKDYSSSSKVNTKPPRNISFHYIFQSGWYLLSNSTRNKNHETHFDCLFIEVWLMYVFSSFLNQQDEVFCAPTVWLSMPERLLRDSWDFAERLLRIWKLRAKNWMWWNAWKGCVWFQCQGILWSSVCLKFDVKQAWNTNIAIHLNLFRANHPLLWRGNQSTAHIEVSKSWDSET